MENRKEHIPSPFQNEGEVMMSAAEYLVQSLFEQADNDSQYRSEISAVREALLNGGCNYTSEEIAERILAWSAAL